MAPIIYSSTHTPTTIPDDLSIPQFMVRYNPDAVPNDKVIHTDTLTGKSITYGGLREQAAHCAVGLQNWGMKPNDVIFCVIPNSTDFVLLTHSVWWIGGTFAAINPASTVPELTHAIKLVNPKFVCVYPDYLENMKAAVAASGLPIEPKLMTIITKPSNDSVTLPHFPSDFTAAEESLPPYNPSSHNLTSKTTIATIGFTSGTTGLTKAAAMSHYALVAHTISLRISLTHIVHSGTRQTFFPMYCHLFGLVVVLLNCCWVGNFTCGMHKLDLEEFCRLTEKYRANYTYMVPTVAAGLVHSGLMDKYDMSSIEYVTAAAAPLKADLQRRITAKLGVSGGGGSSSKKCNFEQAYGMTECGVVTHSRTTAGVDSTGSVGTPISGVELRIVDPQTLKDVQPGQEGELWVRAPWVTMGYVGDEEATAAAFACDDDDEEKKWYRTGDIVIRGDDSSGGNLWVNDRLKEMIKYKGFQVSPSELEAELQSHEHVVEAAVRSYWDEMEATEVPVGFVVLRQGVLATNASASVSASASSAVGERVADDEEQAEKARVLDKIREYVDQRVADHKRLRGGIFEIKALPKNGAGKILREDLPVMRARLGE